MTLLSALSRRTIPRSPLRRAAVLAALTACSGGDDQSTPFGLTHPGPEEPPASLVVAPRQLTLPTDSAYPLTAVATSADGDTVPIVVSWARSGGSVTLDGRFSAGEPGTYVVVARSVLNRLADTAVVTVVAADAPAEPPVDAPTEPTLAVVQIAPEAVRVATGVSQQFRVVGRLSDSSATTPSARYATTGGTVDPSGRFTAPQAPGRYLVIALSTDGRLADTSVVDVEPVVAPPPATGGGLWRSENFTTYRSTSHYFSDPNGWIDNDVPDWFNQQHIALDFNERYEGHPTLRYDWPAGGCGTERQISTKYVPPPSRELWVEVAHKFATNFNSMERPCGGSAYKLIFFWQRSARFDLVNGVNGHHWFANNPQNPPKADGPAYGDGTGVQNNQTVPALNAMGNLWDGKWHVYRFHIRMSSCATCGNGAYQVWVDGKLVVDRQNLQIANSVNGDWSAQLESIILGGNANNGPKEASRTWWGQLKIYTANPGW